VGQHPLAHAAQHQPCQPAPTARAHDDQVAAACLLHPQDGISWAVVEVATELQALELSKISRMTITKGVVQGFTEFSLWMYSRYWSVGVNSALRTIVVYKSKRD
jgi:hypothetical protein